MATQCHQTTNSPFGIVAGDGELPFLLAESVLKNFPKRPIVFIPITKSSARLAQQRLPTTISIFPLGVGQVEKVTKTFQKQNVKEISIIGKVEKNRLLKPLHFDTTALKILARSRHGGDQSILASVLNHFEAEDIRVLPQIQYLGDFFPTAGVLTKKQPTQLEWLDINYGLSLARSVADLDIGQTVVVKNRMVLAVEAIEGTDSAIRRAGDLAGKGFTVIKTAATNHDFRIDTPTVGRQTLEIMKTSGAKVLAVEAKRVLLIRPSELVQLADEYRIRIIVAEQTSKKVNDGKN